MRFLLSDITKYYFVLSLLLSLLLLVIIIMILIKIRSQELPPEAKNSDPLWRQPVAFCCCNNLRKASRQQVVTRGRLPHTLEPRVEGGCQFHSRDEVLQDDWWNLGDQCQR